MTAAEWPDFEALTRAVTRLCGQFQAVQRVLTEAVNEEVYVAGLEGRYLVQGGLLCHGESDLDRLVRSVLRPDLHADFPLDRLTPANRAQVAVAAIRGHVGAS